MEALTQSLCILCTTLLPKLPLACAFLGSNLAPLGKYAWGPPPKLCSVTSSRAFSCVWGVAPQPKVSMQMLLLHERDEGAALLAFQLNMTSVSLPHKTYKGIC